MTFDDKAKDWDNNPQFIVRAKILAEDIRTIIQPKQNMNALDLGCGTGLLSYFLKDDFGSITLADTSKGMLEVLATRISNEDIQNFHPLLLDLSSADYPEDGKRIDVVYSSMAFHHIADIDQVMQRLYKITNDGAYVCIADLDKEDGRFHSHDPLFDGRNGFERTEIESFFTRNGFEVYHYKISLEIEREFADGEKKKYPVFLIIGKKRS